MLECSTELGVNFVASLPEPDGQVMFDGYYYK
jgi:hypothetical protein